LIVLDPEFEAAASDGVLLAAVEVPAVEEVWALAAAADGEDCGVVAVLLQPPRTATSKTAAVTILMPLFIFFILELLSNT